MTDSKKDDTHQLLEKVEYITFTFTFTFTIDILELIFFSKNTSYRPILCTIWSMIIYCQQCQQIL